MCNIDFYDELEKKAENEAWENYQVFTDECEEEFWASFFEINN